MLSPYFFQNENVVWNSSNPMDKTDLLLESRPVPIAQCEAVPVPVQGVGQPKYPQNMMQPNMAYVQQHAVYPPQYPVQQEVVYGGGARELLSNNLCQCQSKKNYKGVFRFPNNGRLRLHCCACQSNTYLDTRDMLFPPSNNAIVETSGCQQRLIVYHSADVSVSSDLGGCQSTVQALDKRPKESKLVAQPFAGRHITVTQSKSCCLCQSSVVAMKLDQGQKPPAACVIS